MVETFSDGLHKALCTVSRQAGNPLLGAGGQSRKPTPRVLVRLRGNLTIGERLKSDGHLIMRCHWHFMGTGTMGCLSHMPLATTWWEQEGINTGSGKENCFLLWRPASTPL